MTVSDIRCCHMDIDPYNPSGPWPAQGTPSLPASRSVILYSIFPSVSLPRSDRHMCLLVEQILPVALFSLFSRYPSFSILFELLGTTTHHLCPKYPTPLASTSLFKLPNVFALQIFPRCQYPGVVTKCSDVSGSILSIVTSISSMNPYNPMRQGLYY